MKHQHIKEERKKLRLSSIRSVFFLNSRFSSCQVYTRHVAGGPVLPVRSSGPSFGDDIVGMPFSPIGAILVSCYFVPYSLQNLPSMAVPTTSTDATSSALSMMATDPTFAATNIELQWQQQVCVFVVNRHKDIASRRAVGTARAI